MYLQLSLHVSPAAKNPKMSAHIPIAGLYEYNKSAYLIAYGLGPLEVNSLE